MRKLFIALILGITLSFGGIGLSTSYAQDAGVDKPAAAATAEAPTSEAAPAPADAKPEEAAPADSETNAEQDEAAGWLLANWHILAASLASLLVAFGFWSRIKAWIIRKVPFIDDRVMAFVEEAVTETNDEYVNELKIATEAKGRKLNEKEIKKAQNMAINKIKEKAKTEGIKIAKEQLLPSMIETVLDKIRGEKNA